MDLVRCLTCGKVLAWTAMRRLTAQEGLTPEAAMNRLGFRRFCCRAHLAFSADMDERALDAHERNETAMRHIGDRITYAPPRPQHPREYQAR